MTHAVHVPADFVSTFRHRFAPLFGRKIGRQRSEQYLGGLLGGRAERRNVTSLAGTVDGATARALGWLLNKSPWQTRPIVDALQRYVGDTFGALSVDADPPTTEGACATAIAAKVLQSARLHLPYRPLPTAADIV